MEELTFFQFNQEACRMHKEEDGLYRRLARQFGLPDSAFWVLYALEASGKPVTQAEVCNYLSLSKQTVNSSIRTLERQGLIRLTPGRGREEHIHFTEKGRRLAEERILPVMEAENRTLAELGEDAALVLALQQKHLEIFRRRARALIANQSDETT